MSVLVFPAGMPAGLAFAHRMSRSGKRVVGASSLPHDPECGQYGEFAQLPWVLDKDFGSALAQLVSLYEVNEIYTPHPVVWDSLAALLPSLKDQVRLHPQDWDGDLAEYARQRARAEGFLGRTWQTLIGEPRPTLTPTQTAGLIRLFEMTPGQCSYTKLEAIISLFRDLPPGDIVEVGSLFGRTALVFSFLAKHYQTGKVLCVDPWSGAEMQQGSPAVDRHSSTIPMQAIFEAFASSLSPWYRTVNYIRKTSVAAAADYASGAAVVTEEFGKILYSRRISILHLDGNHAFESIQNDIRAWGPLVGAGGWIIFDDYRWPFGDGPQRVADDFCLNYRNSWSTAFEAGGALFVRVNESYEYRA